MGMRRTTSLATSTKRKAQHSASCSSKQLALQVRPVATTGSEHLHACRSALAILACPLSTVVSRRNAKPVCASQCSQRAAKSSIWPLNSSVRDYPSIIHSGTTNQRCETFRGCSAQGRGHERDEMRGSIAPDEDAARSSSGKG